MGTNRIPNPVIAVVSQVIAGHHTHSQLDMLFLEKGAPGDPPIGNKVDKCALWLKRCNEEPAIDAFSVLGGILENFMEVDPMENSVFAQEAGQDRTRVRVILERYGLSYQNGGTIFHSGNQGPTKTLYDLLKSRDVPGISTEMNRALKSAESDPPAAVTAACASLEALCKTYIEEEKLEGPSDKSIKGLWKTVSTHLGFDPSVHADDDIKRVLSGITSVIDGVGALRTHAGSAHGHGKKSYKLEPRHARLTMNAAYSIVLFTIETWEKRGGHRT
jgi:hypothetical protein